MFNGTHNQTEFLVGAAVPGIPLIAAGRSRYIYWGTSASMADVSDLYKENIDQSTNQYLVDGKWRDLDTISYDIKVKN